MAPAGMEVTGAGVRSAAPTSWVRATSSSPSTWPSRVWSAARVSTAVSGGRSGCGVEDRELVRDVVALVGALDRDRVRTRCRNDQRIEFVLRCCGRGRAGRCGECASGQDEQAAGEEAGELDRASGACPWSAAAEPGRSSGILTSKVARSSRRVVAWGASLWTSARAPVLVVETMAVADVRPALARRLQQVGDEGGADVAVLPVIADPDCDLGGVGVGDARGGESDHVPLGEACGQGEVGAAGAGDVGKVVVGEVGDHVVEPGVAGVDAAAPEQVAERGSVVGADRCDGVAGGRGGLGPGGVVGGVHACEVARGSVLGTSWTAPVRR